LGKVSTSIVKSSFSKKNCANYKLSILYGIDSLSYCILDAENEILVLKKYHFFSSNIHDQPPPNINFLKEVWDQDDLLNLNFSQIKISLIHPHYTIIPSRLYKISHKNAYLDPLKNGSETITVSKVNNLSAIDAKLIFSVPKLILEFFETTYGEKVQFINNFTALINGIARQMDHFSDQHIWLNVHPGIVQILLFDNKTLIFSNQFSFKSDKDFLYFVMLVYKEFKLNPKTIPLHISGQLVKESAIYKNLDRYIENINFTDIPENFLLSKDLTESPFYFFFDLLSV